MQSNGTGSSEWGTLKSNDTPQDQTKWSFPDVREIESYSCCWFRQKPVSETLLHLINDLILFNKTSDPNLGLGQV